MAASGLLALQHRDIEKFVEFQNYCVKIKNSVPVIAMSALVEALVNTNLLHSFHQNNFQSLVRRQYLKNVDDYRKHVNFIYQNKTFY